jgi:hypothetical protein
MFEISMTLQELRNFQVLECLEFEENPELNVGLMLNIETTHLHCGKRRPEETTRTATAKSTTDSKRSTHLRNLLASLHACHNLSLEITITFQKGTGRTRQDRQHRTRQDKTERDKI